MKEKVNGGSTYTPFLSRLRGEAKQVDVVLAIIPLLLVAVFLFPLETRRAFVFDYQNPTVMTAFSAHYVHLSISHLISNLIACTIFLLLAYLLVLSNGVRGQLYTELFVILFIFPVLLSYLNLAIPRSAVGYGFSGLNMALLGYIAVEFTRYTGNYYLESIGVEDAIFSFLVLTTFVSAVYARMYRIALFLTVASSVFALGYLVFADWSWRELYPALIHSLELRGYIELAVFTILIIIGYTSTAFFNPVLEAGVTNVYIHFLGFCIGFINSYVFIYVNP